MEPFSKPNGSAFQTAALPVFIGIGQDWFGKEEHSYERRTVQSSPTQHRLRRLRSADLAPLFEPCQLTHRFPRRVFQSKAKLFLYPLKS
jgi:hypothetical protein